MAGRRGKPGVAVPRTARALLVVARGWPCSLAGCVSGVTVDPTPFPVASAPLSAVTLDAGPTGVELASDATTVRLRKVQPNGSACGPACCSAVLLLDAQGRLLGG